MNLDRPQLRTLINRLDTITQWLAAELDTTITRQTQHRDKTLGTPGGTETPLAYNEAASDAAYQLHGTLLRWVQAVCNDRDLTYPGNNRSPHLAAWLSRNIFHLAQLEDAADAYTDIDLAYQAAMQAIDRRRDPRWKTMSVTAAANTRLNARGIEALARELGGDWAGIDRDRVRTLHRAGHIQPIDRDDECDMQLLFEAGDVLVAHIEHPPRPRRRKTA